MLGRSVIQTVSMASCCVLAIVEASRPIPKPVTRNTPESRMIRPRSPRIGTPNHQCPTASTSIVLKNPSATYGISLPTINSHGRMGVTISCSIVPRSRSRTTEEAVRMAAMAYRIMPITPGIIKCALIRSGLNQTVVRTSTGGWTRRLIPLRSNFCARMPVEWACPISCEAERAVEALVGSEPSRMKAICASPWLRR